MQRQSGRTSQHANSHTLTHSYSHTLALLLVGLCLLASSGAAQAAEIVVAEHPFRVLTSSDPAMFPESWRGEPVSASGESLPAAEFARAHAILARAAAKYPPQVLQRHLEAVYVLSDLRYSGVTAAGTNSRTVVYLKIRDPALGFTDAYVEGVFHAEFSSILLRNQNRDFDAAAWQRINPPDFKYSGDGVDAVRLGKVGQNPSEALNEAGFLNEYSQSSLENDFNAFAILIFSGDRSLRRTADNYPKLARKLRLTLEFYRAIDPAFTEDHFRSLLQ